MSLWGTHGGNRRALQQTLDTERRKREARTRKIEKEIFTSAAEGLDPVSVPSARDTRHATESTALPPADFTDEELEAF